jgi:hypothetical protein
MAPGPYDAKLSPEDARSNAMKCTFLVATLIAGCAPALASQQIAPVQVTAAPEFQMEFDCANPTRPSRADVAKLLDARGVRSLDHLANGLLGAVRAACNAGVPRIAVQLTLTGERVAWEPRPGPAASLASN